MRRIPLALVACVVLVFVWLVSGVSASEAARFMAYEVGFVLVPGMVLHAALSGSRSGWLRLERLSIGFALGLAVELAAFTAAAAFSARGTLVLYPLPFYIGAGIALLGRRRRGGVTQARPVGHLSRGGLAVAGAVLAFLAIGFFLPNPLARSVTSVAYDQDLVYHLSLSAEAKNRWPMGDPNVAGEPLHYHTFANRSLASVSEVTGIPLDVLLLRLWPSVMLMAIAGLVVLLTGRIGGSPKTALLAVALALLAGELDADTRQALPFLGGSVLVHLQSPSFFHGAVFFLAAVFVLFDVLSLPASSDDIDGPAREAPRLWGSLVALLLLAAAASGSKANVIPVTLGGLGLWAAVDTYRSRRLKPAVLTAGGILLFAFAGAYVLMYSGGGGGRSFELVPGHFGNNLAPDLPNVIAGGIGVFGLAALLAPLVGIAGLVVARGWRLPPDQTLLAGMFAAGLAAFVVLYQPGGAEVYFLLYGTLAAIPLSALGLTAALHSLPCDRATLVRVLLAGAGVMLVVLTVSALALGAVPTPTPTAALVAAWVLIAVAVGTAHIVARRVAPESDGRSATVAIAVPLILLVCFLDYPLDTGSRLISRWTDGKPAWQESEPGVQAGLTADLREGLLWVRDHTPRTAVVASNNVFISPGFARYFYYSGFGERRTYIGGWDYSERAFPTFKGGALPADLQRRVQTSWAAALGSPQAVDALRSDGVNYLLVDKLNGQYADVAKLDAIVRPQFSNAAVGVYELGGPTSR